MSRYEDLTTQQKVRMLVMERIADNLVLASTPEALITNVYSLSDAILNGEPANVKPPVILADGKKIVSYMGNGYVAPEWANYVAADYDGELFFYENDPGSNARVYNCRNGDMEASSVRLPRLAGEDDTYPREIC